MIKLLIGGSPCTYWSIAQKNNRETTAEGLGWELFKNYLIAKEKFKPDFFLYENNKSAATAIKEQIKHEFGVANGDARYIEINSALVSAQNRQRFYVHNCGDVGQPKDRGILLRDILESGTDLTQNEKAYALTASYDGAVPWNTISRKQRTMVAEPVTFELSEEYFKGAENGGVVGMTVDGEGKYRNGSQPSQQYRVYSCEGKSQVVNTLTNENYIVPAERYKKTIYKVENGIITINGKQYPIKLQDGHYIIRKLTVKECCRLQTMPDDYCRVASKRQAFRGLGNGWTAEVIIHILNGALKNAPRDEEIVVLSMYDGIGTGRYCLDKMGFKNVKYYAYEIDKYAMKIASSNYPDIIQCGDAFAVRDNEWKIGYTKK